MSRDFRRNRIILLIIIEAVYIVINVGLNCSRALAKTNENSSVTSYSLTNIKHVYAFEKGIAAQVLSSRDDSAKFI